MTFEVVEHEPDDQEEPFYEPEYCPACGCPDTLVIRWPDQEDQGGGGIPNG